MNSWLFPKIFLIIILVIPVFSGITLFAAHVSAIDSTVVEVRTPAVGFAESYRTRKEFEYIKASVDIDFMKSFWAYLQKHFKNLTRIAKLIPWAIKLLMWILGFLFFFILVTQTRLYKIFYSGNDEIQDMHSILSSGSNSSIDYDTEIRLMVDQMQYRFAVRLLYLKGIEQLHKHEFIHYSKEKTNVDYLRDLNDISFKPMFLQVTRIYNHVWYGDTEIAKAQFVRFEQSFHSFYSAIDGQK